ncbi:beta-galactosidase [Virgibacillus oceani]|uniref:Beta-galactosidase n=1 Tax=Virgibacillus oceani TaxID=1479511 RepID=A0A917HAU0_9BACI|nr:beta-galactosidase [Virgibacillus oceani]GGG72758.1 beta-galactosidase [Virgibacillus oceani]
MKQAETISIGAGYYPDHWPRERWHEDINLMKEAGIKVLRLAELSWSFLEPREGEFDFAWLDDFIALASGEGLQIILSTPIEASPVWLRHKHPEVVRTDSFGRIHGDRGMHCHNNSDFIFYVNRIVTKMAKHYANNPAVIGWQIDNELRNVDCYCGECQVAFRNWLKDRYGFLGGLNDAWGTCFWSQVYHEWDEVTLPSADQLTISVSQKLDFTRFGSDSTVNHLNRQVDIIRSYAPHHFITHNMLGWYPKLNAYKLAEKLDFISWDCYPHVDGDNNIECFLHDHYRAVKGKGHWVMEQKNGYFNYSDYNLAIEPGLIRLWTYQDIARGSDGVMYYRWRSNKYSGEQNPNGLLRHDGTPRRPYYEVQQVTNELEKFGSELISTTVEAPVALIYSYDQMWAFEAHVQYKNFDHREHLLTYYRQLTRLGITADLVDPTADLSKYKMVIAPSMAMISDEIHANFTSYAENGGCLIIGARSGMKTWSNTTHEMAWPGLLGEMAGVAVDEFEVLPDKYANSITYNGKDYPVKVWLDMLDTKTAESLATYNEKFYAGRTAISKNNFGKGVVYYAGVMGNSELAYDLLADIAKERNLSVTLLPAGVYVSTRSNEACSYTFYININREPVHVILPEDGVDVIQEKKVSGEVGIEGLDVLIVKFSK